jgi:alpha-L-fucosidase 2
MRLFHRIVVCCLVSFCLVAALAINDAAGGAQAPKLSAKSIISQYANSTEAPPKYGHYTKASTDALLMGNGDMGLSVGGPAEALRFWINKNDFWRLQGKQRGAQPKLFGWLDIKAPAMQGATYKIEQPIYNPVTRGSFVKGGVTLTFNARVMATSNIAWIELKAAGGAIEIEISPQLTDQELVLPELNISESNRSSGLAGDTLWLRRHYDKNVDIETGMAAAVRLSLAGKWTLQDNKPTEPYEYEHQRIGNIKPAFKPMAALGATQKITLKPGKPLTVLIGVESFFKNKKYRRGAVSLVGSITPDRLAKLHTAHAAWWADYWGKSWVSIPQKHIEKDYYSSLYVLGSAYRDRGFPPGLFGIWVLSECPAWNGDYHLNYNHNAGCYGLYSANRIAQADVCTDPYLDFLPTARRYAKELYDMPGVFFPVGIGPKGIDVTYRAGDINGRYGNPRRSTKKVMHHGQKTNASESLVPINFRFRTTWDRQYAKTFYPFVRDAAAFWVAFLKFEPFDGAQGKDNRYVLYDHAVHENSGPNVNGTAALGLIRMTFKLALDMSEMLGVDEKLKEKRQHVLDHLSKYSTWNIPDMGRRKYKGQKVFLYSEKGKTWHGDNSLGIQHIYPAGQIGLESSPELLKISRDMITVMRRWYDFNGTNSFYPAAVRVGYDPEIILKFLEGWAKRKTANGMKHSNNPHGMESCTTSIVTINMMMCTAHQDVLRVFNCWPRELDAAFENLRVDGAFLVSSRLSGGKIQYVRITSEQGRPCTIQNPWPDRPVKLTRADGTVETLSGKRFTMKTKKGETLLLR